MARFVVLFASTTIVTAMNCSPSEPNELDKLGTVDVTIKGQSFKLWIADSHAESTRGLMFVSREQMTDLPDGTRRGMIFVFDSDQHLSFWMKNTIIPLDIAYVTTAGKVTATHTMAPLDERTGQYPSKSPARFAIEVNADVWKKIGLKVDDPIEIPRSVLNPAP